MATLKISQEREIKALIALEEAERLEREKRKKNHNFMQLSQDEAPKFAELIRDHSAAASMLIFMATIMDKTNAMIATQKTIAELAGVSLPTVKRGLKILEQYRWIEILNVGTTTAYRINARALWQSSREGKFSAFHAVIIANSKEQKKIKTDPLKRIPHWLTATTLNATTSEPLRDPDTIDLLTNKTDNEATS